ncbi:MAG: flagellar hook-associated protein FlgK [Deltaproteobacteria bacterium]|nr:flagellar hook-associated protein FlgK [Deltaproteobacteria bacterium]
MSLLSSLLVAGSGLRAASAGVSTTSHNVANASSEGFHVRSATVVTADPIRRGAAWFGQGTNLTGISRAADSFLARRQMSTAGDAAASYTLQTNLTQVETRFNESAADGIRERLDQFYDALTEATADPADRGLREGVNAAASRLGDVLRRTANGLDQQLSDFEDTMVGSVDAINEKIAKVAALNKGLQAAGGALKAGDLADQRDQLIRELAEEVGATAYFDGEGRATVMVGGHAVVSGIEARQILVDVSSGAPSVFMSADSGQVDLTAGVGGVLGGRIGAHALTVGYRERLDTFATDFAGAMNAQHQAGFDRAGAPGGDLFTFNAADPAGSFAPSSAVLASPDLLAFAAGPSANPGDAGNLEALMGTRTSGFVGADADTPEAWLTDLTSDVGRDTDTAGIAAEANQALLDDLDELDQNLHGVDLDEQAQNLITYQTAYQAAAKVLASTQSMLDTLMSIV